jgi:hypothetical protein
MVCAILLPALLGRSAKDSQFAEHKEGLSQHIVLKRPGI